ncbi:glycosyltransferase family 39 protein [Hymenobacter arizonensis]|uniref:Dolichyl-phosphate-mannose-protein mannosyltransferase n=1 Tax=Hymenobacter arizonensis TaxID=1227077 RepID=A0A1I5X5Y7_HYMAR|nr:glycosyltransferase family 39 protein [Hymenobacter arizonensis]SFQ27358.1 Dolichyl-phosphate-mannose-protein mannosyltransferase [Hymenobacter arizonensis]
MRSIYVWLFTAALAVLALFQDRPWKGLEVFDWDAGGYYVYLPSAFIYGDLARADSLQRLAEAQVPGQRRMLGLREATPGKFISKYPLGVALGELPWFLGAHAYAKLHGDPANGFSRPYQQIIMVAGLVYGLFGLWLVRKLLLRYFDDGTTAWTIAGVGLGTNFFAYVSYEAAISHAALFMWQAALLYCTVRWHETFRTKWAAGIGLFLGLAVLCRPTEALYVVVPLAWGITSWAAMRQRVPLLLNHAGQLLLAAAIGGAVLSLQLLFWRTTTGQWVLYSYGDERFDFLRPHLIDGLFSFRKGWLLYTPLVGLMLLGLLAARRYVPAAVTPILVLLPLVVYVTFSWGQWAYGGGFSARPLVSLYPLLALPLAALLLRARQRPGLPLVQVAVAFCICLNLWQTWQYAAGILLYDNNTAELYWRNFFHTSL